MTRLTIFISVLAFALFAANTQAASTYYGKFIGSLKQFHHALAGDVYVVDSRTLHIRNLNYDGEGPAAYFYVSNTKTPNENGIKLRDERGSTEPLKRYRKKHITLTLPEGKTISNIKWFYVWCDEFAVNFGDVKIPKNLDFPKPQKISRLNGVHAVSSDNVVVVDAQTLLIPSFSYDGEAPDAKFWVGNGNKPTPQGVRVPDENGKEDPLRKYDKKTIVLTLPGDITVFDIGNFAIWCEAFTVDFGHIEIPKELNVPPSLKMLGVSPQSKLNCEILHDDLAFEVRWAVAGESIVIQLVAKLEKGEYMSFGLSGQIDRNVMIGGDVVVAWIDHETLNGYAYDYYLDAKSQCAGNRGSCPDVKLSPNTENIRLLNAALVNGYSIVTYQRPLRAYDEFDLPIYTNGSQAIIWAIGPLNSLQEVSYHSITSKGTTLIDFGRPPQWNCPIPESDASVANSDINDNYESSTLAPVIDQTRITTETTARTRTAEREELETPKTTTRRQEATPAPVKREKPWDIPAIQCYEPEDGIFYAQMGPTGGKRGYPAITGHVGWGISWYINGLLIPEINVVRGRTYTFVVEGGLDPEIPAKYHPFYITDDPVGGYAYKTPEDRAKVHVYAGVAQNQKGEPIPTGTGRLCNWTPDPDQPPADEFASFGAYQRTLSLVCDHGDPGVVQWTPDDNTPDTVYYQCYSHRYLGWKINVHNSCDKEEAESEQVTTRIHFDEDNDRPDEPLLTPSNKVEVRVKASTTNITSSRPIGLHDKRLESKNKAHSSPSHFKDAPLSDFAESEQYILQDPYLPPPPYQKNFDYQSMQTTEPMKEIKTITEAVVHKEYPKASTPAKPHIEYSPKPHIEYSPKPNIEYSPKPHIEYSSKPHMEYSVNTTKAHLPLNIPKHKNYPHKEPYMFNKPPMPLAQFEYQIPAMRIHVIKHPKTGEPYEQPLIHSPKPQSNRPYRHSVMFKKPVHKVMPYNFHPRPLNIPAKPAEPLVSGSIPLKSVITPPSRTILPKVPPTKLVSHIPQPPIKKPSFLVNRKREEPKPPSQALANRIEDHIDRKYPGGFDPTSIVVESGFKPIIPSASEKQNPAQDRMTEDVEDYVEQEVSSSNTKESMVAAEASVADNSTSSVDHDSKNPFAGKEPEQFEPIFIPSPVIDEQRRKKKPVAPVMDHQHFKKVSKPDQKIAYVWPNEEAQQNGIHNIRDVQYYDFNSAPNTISSSHTFKTKPEAPPQSGNFENFHSSSLDGSSLQVSHGGYKVTESLDSSNAVNATNIATDKTEQKSGLSSKYKVKYIPVGYAVKDSTAEHLDSKLIIRVPDTNESSTSTNSSTTTS